MQDFPISSLAVECGANSTFSYCGPACPTTCYSVRNTGGDLQCSDASCVEGCFCDAGFVLEGNECVSEESCGCVSNGFYHLVSKIQVNLKDTCTGIQINEPVPNV